MTPSFLHRAPFYIFEGCYIVSSHSSDGKSPQIIFARCPIASSRLMTSPHPFATCVCLSNTGATVGSLTCIHLSLTGIQVPICLVLKLLELLTWPSMGAMSDPIHSSSCIQLDYYRCSERYEKAKALCQRRVTHILLFPSELRQPM